MSACTVARRRRCEQAATTLHAYDVVAAVDVLPPTRGPHDGWTVEAVMCHSEVPVSILSALAAAELSLLPDATGTRGEPMHTVVVARA